MSYNVQYGHMDRAALNKLASELEEQITELENKQPEPTPDPEPTGDTTAYQECCELTLNGEWNPETNTCTFDYDGSSMLYGTEDLDLVISCTNSGGTWNAGSSTCSFDPVDPTPDPEPTGDTTSYEEYCTGNLGGEWNSETNICTFEYNGMTHMYGTDTIDAKIACESTPGSTWDYDNVTCCDPACRCVQDGGTWDYVNNECTYPEPGPEPDPDPCEGYADPMECNCVNMGGSWIVDPETGIGECLYPEDPEV